MLFPSTAGVFEDPPTKTRNCLGIPAIYWYEIVQTTALLGEVEPAVPPVVTQAIVKAVPTVRPGFEPVQNSCSTMTLAGTMMTKSGGVVPIETLPLAVFQILRKLTATLRLLSTLIENIFALEDLTLSAAFPIFVSV